MFIVRYNNVLQVAANSFENGQPVANHFEEIEITWNSQKLSRALWKSKKFYNSPRTTVLPIDFGDIHLGKAYGYVNKLLACKWLDDVEYNNAWNALLQFEHSPIGQASLWASNPTLTGLYQRAKLDGVGDFIRLLSYADACAWFNNHVGKNVFTSPVFGASPYKR